MATIKAINSKLPIRRIIKYVTNPAKTRPDLISGKDLLPEAAIEQMTTTKLLAGKTGGRTYKHVIQSFKPGEVTPEQAHQIGLQMAEEHPCWSGHEVLVVTHIDRQHIHNHFVVNSVSYVDGIKLHESSSDLERLKELSNTLCQERGLSIIEPRKQSHNDDLEHVTSGSTKTYRLLVAANKGEAKSYIKNIAESILEVRKVAKSREEFVKKMADKGIGVKWTDTRRNITYIDLARQAAGENKCKVKDIKLTKYYNIDVSKNALEADFAANKPQLTVGQAVTMLSALQHQLEDRQTHNRRYIMFYNSIFGDRSKTINLMKDFASGCLYKRKSRLVQQIETLKAQQKELFAKHHMTNKLADTLRTLEKEEARKTEKLKEVQRQIDNYKDLGPRNKRRLQYAIDRANRTQPVMYSKAVASEGANKTIKAQLERLKELLGAFVRASKGQVLTMGLAALIDEVVQNPSSNTLDGAIMTAAREIKPVPARQQQQYAQKTKTRQRDDGWEL